MKVQTSLLSAVVLSLGASQAQAHIGVSTAQPAVAATTQEFTFTVGHGCEGADTTRIEVSIPEGVGGVRPLDSVFGKARLTKDATTGRVTGVTWTKAEADVLPEDTQLYKLTLRAALPDVPFTTLFFPTVQTCRKADGTVLTAKWVAATTEHDHAGGGASTELPAPALFVLPARTPGWNKYTVTQHVHDLSVFNDAQIVWAGKAAYSPSAQITSLIAQEPDTQVLREIHPDTEIWVRY
jgi:periplasmic copper chaperone A